MVFEEIYDDILKKNEEFGKSQRAGIKERFSPTDLGGCQRKLALQFFNAPEDISQEDDNVGRRVLSMGNIIHQELQAKLKQSLKEIKSEHYFRVPLNKENPDIIFSGSCDSLMFHDTMGIIALEYKSINGFAYKYILDEPKKEHLSQLNMYLHYFKIDKGVIIYYNKNDSTIKEHKIKYDKELAEKDINFIIETQREYVDKLKLPEKDISYTKTAFPCSYCKFKQICYEGKNWKSEHYNKKVEEKIKLNDWVTKETIIVESVKVKETFKIDLSGINEDIEESSENYNIF